MSWLLLYLSPLGLFACYLLYVQHERGGVWIVCKYLGGIPGYLPDVAYNYLMCAVMGVWPEWKNRTITAQLPVLAKLGGKRAEFAIALANFLNYFAPSGAHVKL